MKKVTTAIALAASVVMASQAYAKRPHFEAPSEEQMAEMITVQQEAVDELDLRPAVAEQVKTLIAESSEKRIELQTSFQEQREALKEEYDASLSELLTEDEIDELKSAMRSSMKEKFAAERGERKFRKDKGE
ncbi:hypothetical protein [Halioxenophilus aromaticivorans]|uniref:Zinc resistance-associated protein n=1 Tax=Halioxenophilus aromaticivorans TaxID=1306992 RepID=A0AAV3U9J2_9ALTE